MIHAGFYECRWYGCGHKTTDGDAMDQHVVDNHTNH